MKPTLLLTLIFAALACSHEHPLTDHEHTHDHDHPVGDHIHQAHPGHEHFGLFSLGLPYTYIMRVDPPPLIWGIPPIGVLTRRIGEGEYQHERIDFQFSRYPENFRITNLDLPWLNITPISGGLSGGTINKARVTTDCHDPGHTGYIAFRLSWDTGAADFVYKCPDAD